MPTVIPQSLYFAGQGTLWVARLASDGTPLGYRPLGNCSSVTITPGLRTRFKESQRAGASVKSDGTFFGVSGKLVANVESLDAENIALLTGLADPTPTVASAVSFTTAGYIGGYSYLPAGALSGVASLNVGGTPLTAYVQEGTPYDFRVDENAGLIFINDGSKGTDVDALKDVASAPAGGYSDVGGFLRISGTIAGTPIPGEYGLLMNADDSLTYYPKRFRIVEYVEDDYIQTDIDVSAGLPANAAGARVIVDGFSIDGNYSHDALSLVEATAAPVELYAFLFLGLNGVDDKLYTIRVPRAFLRNGFSMDLINDTIASAPLEAAMVGDFRNPDPVLFEIESDPQGFPSLQ